MRSGDWGNLFILVNSGLFLASVILQNAGVVDWHSASFVEDGFCVTAPKTWRSSHAMSFYADVIGAAALAYLAKKYAGEPFAEPVKDAAPGVFMHGLAHLLTWYHGDKPKIAEADDETKTTKMAMGVVFYTAFYFFLLKSKTPAKHAFGHGLWNALVLVFLVPPTFGFTYVQTSLLWVVALYELLKTKKDRYYDLWALTVGCPVGCLSWAEGLGCDKFYKSLGGHVYYDGIIPASMLLYYYLAVSQSVPARTKAD